MLSDEVEVWYEATDRLDAAAIALAAATLSPDELARHRRFHASRDARDYAAAHALLRQTLSRHDGRAAALWRFATRPGGKPILANDSAFRASFSVSHTRGMVACAVTADADVGVDVEYTDRDVDIAQIASRFFAASENAELMRLDEPVRRARFFDLWTLKESLAKALGAGIGTALNRLVFAVGPPGVVRLLDGGGGDPNAWQFGLFTPAAGYRLAVAVSRSGAPARQLVLRSIAHEG